MPQIRNLRAPLSPRYTLVGAGTHPEGDDWLDATDAERRRYYRILARHAAEQWDAQLAAGIDWRGEELVLIRPRTWEERRRKYAVWTGPPLTPQYEGSRTRRLAQVAATKDRVVGYWSRRWGKAMRGHCLGTRKLPQRDVCGLTDPGLAAAVRRATLEWRATAVRRPVPTKPIVIIPGARPVLPRRMAEQFRKAQRIVERYPFLQQFRPAYVPPGVNRGAPAPAPAVAPRPRFGGQRSFWGRAFRAAASFLGSLFA